MTHQRGLTLIEIMIGLLVLSVLAMASSPFTARWSQENNITQSGTQIGEMIAIAKARASLNTASVIADQDNDAVSMLCRIDNTLYVKEASSASPTMDCADAQLITVREATLPLMAQVFTNTDENNREPWECACFTSRGLLTTLGDQCALCSADLKFFVHAGTSANGQSYEYR